MKKKVETRGRRQEGARTKEEFKEREEGGKSNKDGKERNVGKRMSSPARLLKLVVQ